MKYDSPLRALGFSTVNLTRPKTIAPEHCQSLPDLLPVIAYKFYNAQHHWIRVLPIAACFVMQKHSTRFFKQEDRQDSTDHISVHGLYTLNYIF